jgi:hypothetical protein
MMVLGPERDVHIASLQAPAGVVRLTRGEHVHSALDPWCRKLAFSLEPDDFAPTGIRLIPLWEGENSITGFYFSDAKARTFIRYDVEYIEEFLVLGSRIEDAIRDIVLEYVEDDEVADVLASLGISELDLGRFIP